MGLMDTIEDEIDALSDQEARWRDRSIDLVALVLEQEVPGDLVQHATNGNPYFYRQCAYCGQKERILLRDLTNAQMGTAIRLDGGKERDWYERKNQRHSELCQQAQQKEKDDWRQYYEAVLASPEWAEKRQKVLARDKH